MGDWSAASSPRAEQGEQWWKYAVKAPPGWLNKSTVTATVAVYSYFSFILNCEHYLICSVRNCSFTNAQTYFLLQLNTNGVGLFQVDGVSPQLVTEGGELMEAPLPEGPLGQLKLVLGPRHCGYTRTHTQMSVWINASTIVKHMANTLSWMIDLTCADGLRVSPFFLKRQSVICRKASDLALCSPLWPMRIKCVFASVRWKWSSQKLPSSKSETERWQLIHDNKS